MKSWLSQNSHSWSMVPSFQWPIVAMLIAKRLPKQRRTSPSNPRCAVDTARFVAVGPGDDDVLAVAFVQPVPLLIAEDLEVQGVELLEVVQVTPAQTMI
jgi:hypothetical protein